MTFLMATDGYPAMHQPWGHWPPLAMQGPYMTPSWQSSVPSNGSCMYGMSEYRSEKPPLTQLQELTSVFPAPEESHHEQPQTHHPPAFLSDSHFRAKERYGDRECDSGYAPDLCRSEKLCEPDAGYGSDRPGLDVECESGPRECDSGFGPNGPGKEESEILADMCGECDSSCARDLPVPAADSDSGCADLTGKWEEETTCALPGFHQAFGSTEIGRFSRNDFFTNPSPPQALEPPSEPPRKAVRKPRSPRVKQVRRERPESPKQRAPEPRSVPMPETMACNSRMCGAPYDACAPRYCADYSPQSAPYSRAGAPYPSYPSAACELPYFRPFSFPMGCAQAWNEPRWPAYQPPMPTYPQHYQQYQTPQPWASANVYPFMRLDY